MVITEAWGRTDRDSSLMEHALVPLAHAAEFHASDHRLPLIAVLDVRRLELQCLSQALSAERSWIPSPSLWQPRRLAGRCGDPPAGIGSSLRHRREAGGHPGAGTDLQALVSEFPRTPTIVIGDIETPAHVVQVLAYGVRGYIPTSVDLNIALEAIRLAQAGGIFVPANCLVQSHRQGHTRSATSADPLSRLFTKQQAAVADALRRGKANKIIAYELNLAESTVKVHIRNIMRKVQARNRTEVAFKISSYLGQSAAPGVGPDAGRGEARQARIVGNSPRGFAVREPDASSSFPAGGSGRSPIDAETPWPAGPTALGDGTGILGIAWLALRRDSSRPQRPEKIAHDRAIQGAR